MRRLGRSDVDTLVGWAAGEGWDPGSRGCRGVLGRRPRGVPRLRPRRRPRRRRSGRRLRPRARVRRSLHPPARAPRRRARPRALGARCWPTCAAGSNPGAPIGLDAVAALQPFYAAAVSSAAHDTSRIRFGDLGPAPAGLTPLARGAVRGAARATTPATSVPTASRSCGPGSRSTARSASPPSPATARSRAAASCGRPAPASKIGPLFAADAATVGAHPPRACWPSARRGRSCSTCPARTRARSSWRLAWATVRCSARRGCGSDEPPPIPWSNVFGMTTLELG